MKRLDRYKFLTIFGDDLPHSWFEVINLGVRLLKIHQFKFEKEIFKRALEAGLIRRIETEQTLRAKNQDEYQLDWKDYDYRITPKGDDCLRNEQISRDGDYSYYKNYDRTVHGKYGVDHFSPIPPNLNGHSKR